jgi:DNA-binding transcriptional ArsR family regulator
MKNFSNEAYYLFFSTLANRTRLAIIDALKDSPKNISEISATLKLGQDVVSVNLKQLEKCVLVLSESAGNERLYSLNKEIIEPLSDALEFHTAKYCPRMRQCVPQGKLREYLKKEAKKETFIEHE